MKTSKIYVAGAAGPLKLGSGAVAVAVYPAQPGNAESYLLLGNGTMSRMPGARIAGVGVKRYLEDQGFALAEPGNELAESLADKLDIREGCTLVEQALAGRAQELQRRYGGQYCTVVPFDASKPSYSAEVEPYRGTTTTVLGLGNSFSSAMVSTKYESGFSYGANLSLVSLVGPDGGDPETTPRCTEYGGLVEHAVFVICNSGLGTLVGAQNLVMPEDAPVDIEFARGELLMAFKSGDKLRVGIDAGDELHVQYIRNSQVLYSRQGLEGQGHRNAPVLGSAIGSIAAVLVRVAELDAVPVKVARKPKKAVVPA